MKRLSLALAAIGLSAGAFAALPAATDPTVVNVPQLPGGFVVGVTGYYLQPTNNNGDLDYAVTNTSTFGSNTSFFGSNLHNVDPGYDWGWGVNVGYIFPNTGNDVNLSYMQLDTSDTSSLSSPNVNPVGLVPFIAGGVFGDVNDISGKAEYDLNQVDLTAGQFIDVGCRLTLHPFAGLRWAQLERKLTENLVVTNSNFTAGTPSTTRTDVTNVSIVEKSDFEGIGPIAGIDASYYVGMGFGVVGHFDGALLVGSIDSSINFNSNTFGTTAVQGTTPVVITTSHSAAEGNFSASNTRRIVPVLDAKLGMDYTYVFNNSANSDLTIEAGWMVSNYFNAVDRLSIANPSNSAPFLAGRTTSDFAEQGPYVSLQFHA